MMYWVNTVNNYMNEHWKHFTFWAVASLLGSTPGCWHQQGGEKKNQPGRYHFLFCLFLLSPNDCGHHSIFWFFLSQFQNSSDFVTNRFMVNLSKKTLHNKTDVWILKSTLLSGITRADKNSGLHPFVSRVEHISSLNPHFNFFTVSLRRLICVHFLFHRPTFPFCLFCLP